MYTFSLDNYSFMATLVSSILLFTFPFSPDTTSIILYLNVLVLPLKDSFYKPQICYPINSKGLRI